MAWNVIHKSGTKDAGNGVGVYLSEEATGASPKTLDFDADLAPLVGKGFQTFELLGFRLDWTATATVDDRVLGFRVRDSASQTILQNDLNKTVSPSASATVNAQATSSTQGNNRDIPRGLQLFHGLKWQWEDTGAKDATDTAVVHLFGILRK